MSLNRCAAAVCRFLTVVFWLMSLWASADVVPFGQVCNETNTTQWDWVTYAPTYNEWVVVGYDGHGTLLLDNTTDGNGVKTIQCAVLVLGRQAGSDGSMVMSGSGTSLYFDTNLYLGYADSGVGELTLQNAANITQPTYQNHHIYIANGVDSIGTMTLRDTGTYCKISDTLRVGVSDGSWGELVITDGAVFESTNQFAGYYAGSYGKIIVDGLTSQMKTWTNADTHIGYNGTGEMVIRNGGYVRTNSQVVLGYSNGAVGTAEVTGAGSLWEVPSPGSFYVGRGAGAAPEPGTGILKAARGGSVQVYILYVGRSSYDPHGTLDFVIGDTGAGAVDCGTLEAEIIQLQVAYLQMHVDAGVNLSVGTQYTLVDYGTLGVNTLYRRFVGIEEGDIVTSPEGYHFRINYATDLGGGDLAITATVTEIPPCVVDATDLFLMTSRWMDGGCGDPDWCGGADLDGSGTVGLGDLAEVGRYWLGACPALWPWQ